LRSNAEVHPNGCRHCPLWVVRAKPALTTEEGRGQMLSKKSNCEI